MLSYLDLLINTNRGYLTLNALSRVLLGSFTVRVKPERSFLQIFLESTKI